VVGNRRCTSMAIESLLMDIHRAPCVPVDCRIDEDPAEGRHRKKEREYLRQLHEALTVREQDSMSLLRRESGCPDR
jgi:hypothetical protein